MGARPAAVRPDASPKLAAIIVRAMSEAPEERPASMHEFAAELASPGRAAGMRVANSTPA